jgi:3-dehydroquinate dehydratase/shikimate dehydrogenase
MIIIKTDRLILRNWKEEDAEPFAQLNADPRVMEYFPSTLSRKESDTLLKSGYAHIKKYGWGKWAVALIDTGEFIGRIGLEEVNFQAPFSPNIELGYRIAFEYWGKGYASEGAKAVLGYGFNHLNLNEIVAFTPAQNLRSQQVMQRIGMYRDSNEDFDHPKLAEDHPLKRHFLYRLNQQQWHLSSH